MAGRSVYGLQISGLDDVAELGDPMNGHDPDLIPVHIRRSSEIAPPPRELDADGGVQALLDGRSLELQRKPGQATFYGPALSTDQLAHPYLGPIAVTFNRWARREVFHAAGFVAAERAWIVMGRRTAGKSTLTAALAAAGVQILADDIVVTDGDVAYSGPRSIDLREVIPAESITHSGWGNTDIPMSQARLGTRLRVALPVIGTRWPVGGWIFLHWADHPTMDEVAMPDLLHRLAARRCSAQLPSDPARILALAALPAWDLRRRRDWTTLADTVDMLLETTTGAAELAGAHR